MSEERLTKLARWRATGKGVVVDRGPNCFQEQLFAGATHFKRLRSGQYAIYRGREVIAHVTPFEQFRIYLASDIPLENYGA